MGKMRRKVIRHENEQPKSSMSREDDFRFDSFVLIYLQLHHKMRPIIQGQLTKLTHSERTQKSIQPYRLIIMIYIIMKAGKK